jgi:hypothetical protein
VAVASGTRSPRKAQRIRWAFANTALTARADKAELDHGVINAVFQPFAVWLPANDGTWRWESIAALVALDNAFDPATNPHSMIIAGRPTFSQPSHTSASPQRHAHDRQA